MSHKIISITTAALVFLLAACAFALSYDAQRQLADDNGLSSNLAYLFPLVVDGLIIVASLSVLRNSMLAESAYYPWFLVILAAFASVAFNVAHADAEPMPRVVASVAPVALVLAFELLTAQISSEMSRRGAIVALDDIKRAIIDEQASLERADELTRQAEARHKATLERLATERRQVKAELATLRQETRGASPRTKRTAERRAKVAAGFGAGEGASAIAKALGASVRTVQRDIELIRNGGDSE